MGRPTICLDYNATTPPHPAVVEAIARALRETPGNPSSAHAEGRKARAAVEKAREHVAAFLRARVEDVTFTSGGTEADNLAVLGAARAAARAGKRPHVVVSAIEHSAVLAATEQVEREGGTATRVPVGRNGRVDPAAVEAALRPETVLVSVMAANNETGVVQPVAEIGARVRARGVLFHTDAVQLAAKGPFDFSALPVDLASISGHKFYGPKGAGALVVRRGVKIESLQVGGSQEGGRRTGTENVAGIAGLGEACRLAAAGELHDLAAIARLRDRLWQGLAARIPGAQRNGDPAHVVPNTFSVTFPGTDGEALLLRLDLEGIAVSAGSACHTGAALPSHVLLAMGLTKAEARSTLRFSLGRGNTEADVDRAVEVTADSVAALRGLAARAR